MQSPVDQRLLFIFTANFYLFAGFFQVLHSYLLYADIRRNCFIDFMTDNTFLGIFWAMRFLSLFLQFFLFAILLASFMTMSHCSQCPFLGPEINYN